MTAGGCTGVLRERARSTSRATEVAAIRHAATTTCPTSEACAPRREPRSSRGCYLTARLEHISGQQTREGDAAAELIHVPCALRCSRYVGWRVRLCPVPSRWHPPPTPSPPPVAVQTTAKPADSTSTCASRRRTKSLDGTIRRHAARGCATAQRWAKPGTGVSGRRPMGEFASMQ